MGYFPTKQTITITRGTGELDIFGKRTGEEIFTKKCRAIEGSHLTVDKTVQAAGATIVCDLKILLDKLADITYDDDIEYINELGTIYRGKPKSIKVQRDFGGKAVLTEVLI